MWDRKSPMSNEIVRKCRRIIGNFAAMEYKPEYYRRYLNNRAYIKEQSCSDAMSRKKRKNK